MGTIEKRLKELNYKLPEPPKPVASYIPVIKSGNLVFTAGQIALEENKLKYEGKVGQDLTLEQGYEAAKLCVLNCLSVIKDEIGDLNRIKKIVKVTGYVSSSDNFNEQPKVLNGASELLGEIFYDKGKHVRSAVGVNELPLNSAVEIEMIVEVRD